MTPVRQKRIRTLLRSRPNGMSPGEIAEELGVHVANVRTPAEVDGALLELLTEAYRDQPS